jgi:uncharacterized protein
MKLFSSLLIGFLFGAGLVVSGMSNPANVLNFLDLAAISAGKWDARLMFVLGGAVAVTAVGFPLARRLRRPLLAEKFTWPTASAIDSPLVIGAVIFGIGWGLAGYCPGPAIANIGAGIVAGIGAGAAIGTATSDMLYFIPALIAGMWAANKFR